MLVSMGKIGGIRLLEKAFATDELSEEDIKYEANVLSMISYRTIWNTFDSCNNYRMPKHPQTNCEQLAPFQPERLARGLMEPMESKTQKSKIES